MRKWNIAGFVIFLVAAGFTGWNFVKDSNEINFIIPLSIFVFVGIVLLGVDRWVGDTKYWIFLTTLLWVGYWGFVASVFFSVASLFALVVGLGHQGSTWPVWLTFGYACIATHFVALALANFIKFVVALLSLPKLQTH